MNKLNIITLGCSKNIVDSEFLATYLLKNGIKVVFDENFDSSKTIVINTCGFIGDAKEESINTILEAVKAKENGFVEKVFVMGCLSQRYKKTLTTEIPEVDGYFGVAELPKILKTLKIDYKTELIGERIISTPKHYGFLKIAEGCNRKCSFCAIPMIRGKHISIPIENLVKEAKYLSNNGLKELILISQDTSFYGFDLYKDYSLYNLLIELVKNDKIEWLRLHYLYPTETLEPVISLMAENKKICNYIDIPFQHISDNILKSMKRGHTEKSIYNLVEMFRKKISEVALRSTMIVGYPNETDKDFEKLLDFVKQTKFERLGVFTYSHEEDTSASKLNDNVPQKVKQERLDEIMRVQSEISFENNQNKIGKTYKVLIDSEENDYFIGRTEFDSPEVDNEVLIKKDNKIKIGEFINVKIESAEEFDLYGQIVS